MNNMNTFSETVELALQDIINFYENSFKISPDQCVPHILSFIENMGNLSLGLSPKQAKKINKLLEKIMSALQSQDYVVVKDCLMYEIKPFLTKIQDNDSN